MKKLFLFLLFLIYSVLIFSQEYDFQMMPSTQNGKSRRASLKSKALARIQEDYKIFSAVELKELEDLYQTANIKSHTEEAKTALLDIISNPMYEKANRMGCAYLYLGTMDIIPDSEKLEYLKTAISKYSDSWYGDSVQVGSYARYMLGRLHLKNGQTTLAFQLFDEILEKYPDSIDHSGNLIKDKIARLKVLE